MASSKDLDDILDAALDELDDHNDNNDIGAANSSSSNTTSRIAQTDPNSTIPLPELVQRQCPSTTDSSTLKSAVVFGPPRPPNGESSRKNDKKVPEEKDQPKQQWLPQHASNRESVEEVEKAVKDMMKQMEQLFPNEDFGKEGNTHVNITPEKVIKEKETSTANNMMENNAQDSDAAMKDAFSNLLRGLSNNDDLDQNMFQNFGDEMTEEMQREWEETINMEGNGKEDVMGHVVDGMMKQLLSREFMYEPIKDITDKFPKWLADNKSKLSMEEYEKYGRQYQYFQRIIDLYDHDPENTERLTELMTELQEYGQPPADIIQELAPDLELDEEGMPKIPDFHGGMPDMSNMNEECIIM